MIYHVPLGAPSRGRGWETATAARTMNEKMPNVDFIVERERANEKSGMVQG